MREYQKVCSEELSIYLSANLFTDEEKKKAETILKVLDGTRIVSAQLLLRKCSHALLQSRFTFD